jgi:hypothetical protein
MLDIGRVLRTSTMMAFHRAGMGRITVDVEN